MIMKAYNRPEVELVKLCASDVVATSAEPEYIQMGEVTNAGTPVSNNWGGLSDGAGF